jgi:hypothetical protein
VIPEFDQNGQLPPGIHEATLDEIERRFGIESEVRRAEMQSLRWLIELVRQDDVRRVVINGSFVTDVPEPNDVDCVLLIGPRFASDPALEKQWEHGLPFLTIELASPNVFDQYVSRTFAEDRYRRPKGMIEVIL